MVQVQLQYTWEDEFLDLRRSLLGKDRILDHAPRQATVPNPSFRDAPTYVRPEESVGSDIAKAEA